MSLDEKDEGLGTTGTGSNNSSANWSNFFPDRRAPGIFAFIYMYKLLKSYHENYFGKFL